MKKNNFFLFKLYLIKINIIFFIYLIFFFHIIIFNKNLSKTKFKNKPKISIFIPIYNKKKYLIKCIQSIKNQSLKNLEIIAVNDYSTDESLPLLKKLTKEDPRIKIINNDRNHGLLYTRAMGILNSTGEYLMNLDPDDELIGKNNLLYLYKLAKKTKVDFLSFGYKSKNKILIRCSNYNKILKQPKLFHSNYNKYNKIRDFLIWNKLIKRDIILKAYNIFQKKIYHDKWNYHEDNIWSILIYKYANSMMCINKLIYKYNSYKESLMHIKWNNIIEVKNFIYKEIMIRKIIKRDLKNKNFINEYYKSFLRINKKIKILKNNKGFKNKFFKILKICIKLKKCSDYLVKSINKLLSIK